MDDGYNILVIDDDAFMRDACHETLTRRGHSVTLAESGRKALVLLEKWSFDLILLDLKMPGMDGMEVLKRIRQLDETILVIVITGFATVETAIEAMKAGNRSGYLVTYSANPSFAALARSGVTSGPAITSRGGPGMHKTWA